MRSLCLVVVFIVSVYGNGVVPVSDGSKCMMEEPCDMVCPFGYKTNSSGCPLCECLEDPCANHRCDPEQKCQPVLCSSSPCTKLTAECVKETKIPCAMPMCATDCPDGFKKNEHGCMTCDCIDKKQTMSCKDLTCPMGHRCEMYLPGCDTKKPDCKMQPTCVPDDERGAPGMMPCPAVDCATVCSFGYRRNAQGCQICLCNDSPCDNHVCTKEEICQVRRKDCSERQCPLYAYCAAKPLCTYDNHDLDCDKNGAFVPLQCAESKTQAKKGRECWCVDDRGYEVDGSRVVVLKDESNLPDCARNITVKLNLTINFSFGVDDIYKYMEQIKITVPKHISKWMLIEDKYIRLEEVGVNHEMYSTFLMVRVTIVHDGQTDLASAAAFLMRKVDRGECRIPLDNDNDLKTESKHVHVHHTFRPQEQNIPEIGDVDTGDWEYSLWLKILFPITGVLIFMFTVCLILLIVRRRRLVSSQFKHRALQNQESFKSNISYYADQMMVGNEEKVKEPVKTVETITVTLDCPEKNDSEA